MGVIYKGLNFDGVSSLDYGIYITGEGVYNAPTRDVEAIEVPGRNGELILDKGRFSNISVTYKAGTFAQSQEEFAEKLSEFRNAILSRVGYKRLEDDYHPDEFRMAIYTNGLEVGPVHYSEAGEFELTFNCKPQRFLKSGETVQTVGEWGPIKTASGSIATFNAEPNFDITSVVINLDYTENGRSAVNITQQGENLLDMVAVAGGGAFDGDTFNADRISLHRLNFSPDNTDVIFSFESWSGTARNVRFEFMDKERRVVKRVYPTDQTPVIINGASSVELVYSGQGSISIKKPMLKLANGTNSAYKPYEGQTINKTLGRTVYGGTLDLLSGELTSTLNADGTEKATPEVFQLLAEEMHAIAGFNRIWADSGDVTVRYRAKPNLLYNPTPFGAQPLFEAHGYGNITINGETIALAEEQPIGDVVLWSGAISSSNALVVIPLKSVTFTEGGTFNLSAIFGFNAYMQNEAFSTDTQASATSSSADFIVNNGSFVFGNKDMAFDVLTANDIEFVAGTAKQVDVTFTINTTAPTATFYAYLWINYEPDENQIRILSTAGSANKLSVEGSAEGFSAYVPDAARYIDLEMGEAYYIEGGAIVSANNSVSLPAILPELKAGLNDITYDDTITELKIEPRWWKI